ncbi:MAG: hypothetical protein PVI86_08000 [Phycisphaerae bacterium]
MDDLEDLLISAVRERATRRIGTLAAELVHADSGDKELTLAEIEFERFLAEACLDCHSVR